MALGPLLHEPHPLPIVGTMTKILWPEEALQLPPTTTMTRECSQCHLKLISEDALESHIITCQGSSTSKTPSNSMIEKKSCTACHKTFSFHADLVSHLEGVHATETCLKCQQVVQGRHDMLLHIKLAHFYDQGHVCCVCQKVFATGAGLIQHFHDSHVLRACILCRHQDRSRATFLRHLRSAHALSLQCKRCPQICPDARALARHSLNIHELQVCNTCNIPIMGMNNYREHFRERHPLAERTGNTPTLSDTALCRKRPPTEESAWKKPTIVKRMANIERNRSLLKAMDKAAQGLVRKPKVFKSKMSPKVFLEKLKQCVKCDYATNQRANLVRHFELVHVTYKCRVCFNPFPGRKAILDHSRLQHLILEPKYDIQDAFNPDDLVEYNKLRRGTLLPIRDGPFKVPEQVPKPSPEVSSSNNHLGYFCHNCGYHSKDYSAWVRHQCHVEKSKSHSMPTTPLDCARVKDKTSPNVNQTTLKVTPKRKRPRRLSSEERKSRKVQFEATLSLPRPKRSPRKSISSMSSPIDPDNDEVDDEDEEQEEDSLVDLLSNRLRDGSETETSSEAGEEHVEQIFQTLRENHVYLEAYLMHTQLLPSLAEEQESGQEAVRIEYLFDQAFKKLVQWNENSPKAVVQDGRSCSSWIDRCA